MGRHVRLDRETSTSFCPQSTSGEFKPKSDGGYMFLARYDNPPSYCSIDPSGTCCGCSAPSYQKEPSEACVTETSVRAGPETGVS